jgi:uncharacterized membrane protein
MQNPPPPNQQGYGYGTPYSTPSNAPLSTSPGGGAPGGKTTLGLDANVASLLGYVLDPICCVGFVLSIVLFLTEKENRFVRFHAMQNLLLLVILIVISVVFAILGIVFGMLHLGLLITGLRFIVGLVFLAALVLSGIKAFQGEMFKLPVIGDLAENIAGKQ